MQAQHKMIDRVKGYSCRWMGITNQNHTNLIIQIAKVCFTAPPISTFICIYAKERWHKMIT